MTRTIHRRIQDDLAPLLYRQSNSRLFFSKADSMIIENILYWSQLRFISNLSSICES